MISKHGATHLNRDGFQRRPRSTVTADGLPAVTGPTELGDGSGLHEDLLAATVDIETRWVERGIAPPDGMRRVPPSRSRKDPDVTLAESNYAAVIALWLREAGVSEAIQLVASNRVKIARAFLRGAVPSVLAQHALYNWCPAESRAPEHQTPLSAATDIQLKFVAAAAEESLSEAEISQIEVFAAAAEIEAE